MNSIIIKDQGTSRPIPGLYRNGDDIAFLYEQLEHNRAKGVIVHSSDNFRKLGYWSELFSFDSWEPFNGKLELSNQWDE
jgi:hypothetical protein